MSVFAAKKFFCNGSIQVLDCTTGNFITVYIQYFAMYFLWFAVGWIVLFPHSSFVNDPKS